MYILISDRKSIVDSAFVERFCIVEKPDACLVVASYSADRAVTIGRYADCSTVLWETVEPTYLRCRTAFSFTVRNGNGTHARSAKEEADE